MKCFPVKVLSSCTHFTRVRIHETQETRKMKTRKKRLLIIALALLAMMVAGCNKTDSSANANSNANSNSSSPGKNSSSTSSTPTGSPSGTKSTAANRFVGTWVEEGNKTDQGSKFTDDGKIIELSSNKQVATYTTSGDDKATITIAEGGTGTATLESDTRMKMVVAGETAYLTKK